MVEYIRQKKIDITDLPADDPESWPRRLHDKGCIGIRRCVIPHEAASDLCERCRKEKIYDASKPRGMSQQGAQ
jgi:hypothetical protein